MAIQFTFNVQKNANSIADVSVQILTEARDVVLCEDGLQLASS